jgi:hypothetical protein
MACFAEATNAQCGGSQFSIDAILCLHWREFVFIVGVGHINNDWLEGMIHGN